MKFLTKKTIIMALEINNSNFNELVSGNNLVVIDFWAKWCGPCREVGKIIEEVAEEYKEKAVIGKCDTDENNELAQIFNVRNIPMLVFIKNGEVKDLHVGLIKKPELTAKIESLL